MFKDEKFLIQFLGGIFLTWQDTFSEPWDLANLWIVVFCHALLGQIYALVSFSGLWKSNEYLKHFVSLVKFS